MPGQAPSVVLRAYRADTEHREVRRERAGDQVLDGADADVCRGAAGDVPCCAAAARPVGGRLVIVGHGVVERQVHGPLAATGGAESLVLKERRYRCRACKAILTVGPRGLVRRRWYGAGAIALAFDGYARGETGASIRRRVSPSATVGGSARERWVTLVRWIDTAGGGRLFGVSALGDLPRRRVAELVVLALAGRAGRALGDDLAEAAFAGAAIAA